MALIVTCLNEDRHICDELFGWPLLPLPNIIRYCLRFTKRNVPKERPTVLHLVLSLVNCYIPFLLYSNPDRPMILI